MAVQGQDKGKGAEASTKAKKREGQILVQVATLGDTLHQGDGFSREEVTVGVGSSLNQKNLNEVTHQKEVPQQEGCRQQTPTRIDLESQQIQPGLGPAHLEDLNIEKEFIGFKNNVVLLDYPGPSDPNIRYGGIIMSQEQIGRCKVECSKEMVKIQFKKQFYANKGPPESDSDEECMKEEYFVEFPPDEVQEMDWKPAKSKMLKN